MGRMYIKCCLSCEKSFDNNYILFSLMHFDTLVNVGKIVKRKFLWHEFQVCMILIIALQFCNNYLQKVFIILFIFLQKNLVQTPAGPGNTKSIKWSKNLIIQNAHMNDYRILVFQACITQSYSLIGTNPADLAQ